MTFNEMKEIRGDVSVMSTTYQIDDDNKLIVKTYLPMEEKAQFIQQVVDAAMDAKTGCFSPVRLNTYYGLAIMEFYCGIEFEDDTDLVAAYDYLEVSGILDGVLAAIPEDERNFLQEMVDDTVADISSYNMSFAGIMQSMTGEASNLGDSLDEILTKIKNREGLELLAEIKNIEGKND